MAQFDNSAILSDPYVAPNPFTQAKSAIDLANAVQNNNLLKGQVVGQGISNETNQASLNQAAAANVGKAAFGILSMNPDQRQGQAGYDNVVAEIRNQIRMNPTAANIASGEQYIASLAPPKGADGTPTDYTSYVARHLVASAALSGPEAISQIVGSPTTQATGGHILNGTQTSPLMGMLNGTGSQFLPGSSTTMTPSVGEQMSRTGTVDTNRFLPNGQPNPNFNQPITTQTTAVTPGLSSAPTVTQVPGGGAPPPMAAPTGQGNGPYSLPPPQGGPPSPQVPPPVGAGRTPPRLFQTTPPANPVPPPFQTGSGQPPPSPIQTPPQAAPVPTSLPAGPVPGTTQPIDASSAQYVNDRNSDGAFTGSMENLQHAMALSKDTTTGAGAARINEIRSFLLTNAQRLGLSHGSIDTASADELGKIFAQTVNSQSPGSDARLGAIQSGSMAMDKSSLANQDLMQRMMMSMRMQHTAFQQFQKSGLPAGQYADFVNKFNTDNHPLSFFDFPDRATKLAALSKMTAAQRQQYSDGLDRRGEVAGNDPVIASTPTPQQQATPGQ